MVGLRRCRGGSASIALLALCCLAAIPSASAATDGFSVSVTRPALIKNAVLAVRIKCPASESRCVGATLAYSPPQPDSGLPALREGLLVAPAQPFSLTRGRSTTLRLLIPLSEVGLFRQARRVVIGTYTLAANPDTKGTASVFESGTIKLKQHDPRLHQLHRLRLRLLRMQLRRNRSSLTLTIQCRGASAQARASTFGGCEGVIDVFGGSSTSTPPQLAPLGGQPFILFQNSTTSASIRLSKARLAELERQTGRYLIVYSIASDRVDMLGAAQLVIVRLQHA